MSAERHDDRSMNCAGLTTITSVNPYSSHVMFSMFVLWIAVFVGVLQQRKWVIPLTLVALVWTLILLRLHMTSPLPLEF